MAKRLLGVDGVAAHMIPGLVRRELYLQHGTRLIDPRGVVLLCLGTSCRSNSVELCSHPSNRRHWFHQLCSCFISRKQSTTNWAAMKPFSQEMLKGSSSRLNSGTTGDGFNSSPVNGEETSTESCAVPDHDPGTPVMSQQPQDKLNKKQKSSNSDSAGQTPTPSLSKQMSTRDFINRQREERLNYHAQGFKLNTEQDS
ncbi:unnamed protein product [Sphagnum compactum]